MMGTACRKSFSETILRLARDDERIIVVTTDARGSVTLGKFAEELPDQFVEVGIAEQNAIGIAAGLATCGKNVFVCGPACFYSARSLEQVKTDVAYSGTNVKVIGVTGGVAYGALGSTHHSLHDIAVFRAIPDINIIIPSDAVQTARITEHLAGWDGAAYVRMGRADVEEIYSSEPTTDVYTPGKANVLNEGHDVAIVACGQMVAAALSAAESLHRDGISARVIDMHTIKPLDQDAVINAALDCGCIVTVEEHSIFGGLGAAVAETVVQSCPVPMTIMGIPDEVAVTGNQQEIFTHYGMTAGGITAKVKELLEKRS